MAYSQLNSREGAPIAHSNSFRKGLGFVPNTISRVDNDPIACLLKFAPSIPRGFCATSDKCSLYESRPTIPLFDLDNMTTMTGNQREKLLYAFGKALVTVGFLGIQIQGVDSLIRDVYDEMYAYFRKSLEIKLLDWQNQKKRGYCYRGFERGPHAKNVDFKESFFITEDFHEWPRTQRKFQRVIGQYFSVLKRIYSFLHQMIFELIGKTNGSSEPSSLLRLAYYPPFKPGDDPYGVWSAPHKDKNMLSILSRGSIPGLQFYSSKRMWEPVVVPNGYLIIAVGQQLQNLSKGRIRARWHHVINPGGKYTRFQRLSTVFYGNLQ